MASRSSWRHSGLWRQGYGPLSDGMPQTSRLKTGELLVEGGAGEGGRNEAAPVGFSRVLVSSICSLSPFSASSPNLLDFGARYNFVR